MDEKGSKLYMQVKMIYPEIQTAGEKVSIEIDGAIPARVLLNIILSAKFGEPFKPEILLSPFVNDLIDSLKSVIERKDEGAFREWARIGTDNDVYIGAKKAVEDYISTSGGDGEKLQSYIKDSINPFII